jgi:diguanylate cyclase (GGDEF)-like protein
MVDIDNFKNCNDSHGHEFGNEILKRVFGIVRDSLRDIDFLARYGGDELAVILPNTSPEPARVLAERIQRALLTLMLPGLEGLPKGRITLSIGGASFPRDAATLEELVVKADKALYAAKTSGRDCVRWAV